MIFLRQNNKHHRVWNEKHFWTAIRMRMDIPMRADLLLSSWRYLSPPLFLSQSFCLFFSLSSMPVFDLFTVFPRRYSIYHLTVMLVKLKRPTWGPSFSLSRVSFAFFSILQYIGNILEPICNFEDVKEIMHIWPYTARELLLKCSILRSSITAVFKLFAE